MAESASPTGIKARGRIGPMTLIEHLLEDARVTRWKLAYPIHDWETEERRGDDRPWDS